MKVTRVVCNFRVCSQVARIEGTPGQLRSGCGPEESRMLTDTLKDGVLRPQLEPWRGVCASGRELCVPGQPICEPSPGQRTKRGHGTC